MAKRKRNIRMEREALRRACAAVGGQTALARKMKLGSQGTVSSWLLFGTPAERVVEIEEATGEPRHKLRPDLFAIETKQVNGGELGTGTAAG